jgi:putative oxidoreductase
LRRKAIGGIVAAAMETNPIPCGSLLATNRCSFAPTLLRLALGLVMFPHGAQKLLGWFGGYGFNGTVQFFTAGLHIPWILAVLVVLVEFVGPIALILGLGTRIAALLVGVDILVAALMVHLPNGLFMNWSGTQKGEGFEFHILVVALALALVIQGGGALSIDAAVTGAPKKEAPPAAPAS